MRLVHLALFAFALLLLGCTGYSGAPKTDAPPAATPAPGGTPPANAPPASSSIEISGFAFSPAEVTVAKGTTVTWTNKDSVGHTITSSSFDSGTISSGGKFSFTFAQAGTYDYYCAIHPSMKGKITVTG